ncbi:MAG: DsbA family protein, partial [Microcoleaceae cyanobacterium]
MKKSASKVIQSSLSKTLLITSLLSLSLVLNSCATGSVTSATPDAKFKEQVLQVIKDNPQVVIDSVQAYQKQQEEQANKARQEILTKLKSNPASIIENSPQMGAKDGKIVLVEFSDFQCPFCAKAQPTIKEFMAKHADQVTLVFKHLPLVRIHPEAIPASAASWAAQQQGKFWEYHNALFEQQEKLGEELY